jgi:hypothetical protein
MLSGYLALAELAFRQCLGFHLQVVLGIDTSGFERDVSEPGADRTDVYPRTQKKEGGGMANRVRTNAFACQRGDLLSRLLGRNGWGRLGTVLGSGDSVT